MVCEKIAFIHYAKSAGRFINKYLVERVLDRLVPFAIEQQGYKIFNSWEKSFSLERDWTEEELFDFAIDRSPYQLPDEEQLDIHSQLWEHGYLDRQFVHNHHTGWTRQSVQEFNRNGWLTFSFLRDPIELLCSLYWWAQEEVRAGTDPDLVLQPTHLLSLSLNDFLLGITKCEESTEQFYKLPDYMSDVKFVAEFSYENFAYFLSKFFDHEIDSEFIDTSKQYKSANKGVEHYLSSGQIDKRTIEELSNVEDIIEFRKFLLEKRIF